MRVISHACLLRYSIWAIFAAVVFDAAARAESTGGAGKESPPEAVDVGPEIRKLVEADWIDSDRLFAAGGNTDTGSARINARGVTTAQDAAGAVDGIKDGRFGFHVAVGEKDPWWQVDLGQDYEIDRVVIYNRTDGGHAPRTRNIAVSLAADCNPGAFKKVYQHDGSVFYGAKGGNPLVVDLRDKNVTARVVRLHMAGVCHFALDEVEVYGTADPAKNIALGKPADQKSVSRHSQPGTMGKVVFPLPVESGGFLLAHTRDIVERGKRLAARLQPSADPKRLSPLVVKLGEMAARVAELEKAGEVPEDVRRETYFDARRIVREIVFTNPLLDIDKLVFVKRHRGTLPHMCDQYYGFTAVPGGGLFVLSDPFGDVPRLTNLLEDATVQSGRLAGQQLTPGAFLSPEVSYDGNTILFAYTANRRPMRDWNEVFPPVKSSRKWTEENCYHIFKVGADGSGLVQLTDGPWDEFDPCFLPSGRIVFISERRGGYVRCGVRACPSFNLCSMEPDGSDIVVLSYFDTNEWHPSVNHDGMIVYTRWDYIDRNTTIAHHLWTCYPDGRDPRAPHGNYPAMRQDRPFAELSIRAIPKSHRYVATAAPHHGYAFGSLVMIDPRIVDDNANSQITRLTPEVPFPEAEGPIRVNEVYGTPWPLSEDDYLCVYDSRAENHGIYWIDRDGNRELIYRDPSISCVSPIPLRPRHVPPVIPEETRQTASRRASGEDRPATIAVANVYDADFTWPEGTKIERLRVLQILPKSVPTRNTPRIGVAEQTNARAVLGSVPVEPDGSVFFEAPPGKLLYFQALDERGMAIQSMRTGTYVHPGENMTCRGCHEHKHNTSTEFVETPAALRRRPSQIEPDVEGSNPFSFVRLVQPALDRNCVECHRREKAIDLSGAVEPRPGLRDKHRTCLYTKSYNNLAEKYGFYFHAHSSWLFGSSPSATASRTLPGQFGAKAAKLLNYLGPEHYGVKLSEEDFHRITLWLDCNSEFYGAYENPEAQARGEVVRPSLE